MCTQIYRVYGWKTETTNSGRNDINHELIDELKNPCPWEANDLQFTKFR